MTEYRVMWEIDVEADSPAEAAIKAQEYATRPGTTATIYSVFERQGDCSTGPLFERVADFDVREGKALTIEEADALDEEGG